MTSSQTRLAYDAVYIGVVVHTEGAEQPAAMAGLVVACSTALVGLRRLYGDDMRLGLWVNGHELSEVPGDSRKWVYRGRAAYAQLTGAASATHGLQALLTSATQVAAQRPLVVFFTDRAGADRSGVWSLRSRLDALERSGGGVKLIGLSPQNACPQLAGLANDLGLCVSGPSNRHFELVVEDMLGARLSRAGDLLHRVLNFD